MGLDVFRAYLESVIGRSLDGLRPQYLSGWQTVEALWPLLQRLQPLHARLVSLPYEQGFSDRADAALESIDTAGDTPWSELPAGVARVLSERVQQGITVAAENEAQGNRQLVPLPPGLTTAQQTKAAALFLLHRMKLPWPPGHQSGFAHPPTSAAAPLRPQ